MRGPGAVPRRLGGWSELRRPADGRVLAGVSPVVAANLGVNALATRVAFVVLSFCGGLGIFLYLAGWLLVPAEGEAVPILRAAMADKRTVALTAAAASMLGALVLAGEALGLPGPLAALVPGVEALAMLVAVWRHAGREDRVSAQRFAALLSAGGTAAPTRRRLVVTAARLLAGLALVAIGISTLLAPKHLNHTDITVAMAAVGVIAGVSLVLAPWWFRLGRDLAAERRERARAQERAEMAAHLHDSVLQTLALIQRSASDPQQVQRLARAQERQLRTWLFDQGASRSPGAAGEALTLAQALEAVQQEVERDHGLRAEVVTVGDAVLDEGLRALVSAAREAVVNAAKWSGADMVSVYAEVEPGTVSVFVRDKGSGFDPAAVAGDRKGLSESVLGRTRRHGGTAAVRSAPGKGTEVALSMPYRRAS
jgi:signal transduction histidine kinase